MNIMIPRIPFKVRMALRNANVRNIEWDMYDDLDEKWFGYCELNGWRIALTVALVTGKACIELLAPLHNEDVLL